MNERRWKQYFRQAGKYLYCDTSQKDIFEKQIRATIADLQNENPMISYEECIAIIGTPQDAAGSFLDTLPENVVAICHRKKRRRTRRRLCKTRKCLFKKSADNITTPLRRGTLPLP